MAKNKVALQVIVLAAGKGTRMKSKKEKVLHEIAGKSMLSYVLETAQGLKPESVAVVLAPGMKAVEQEAKRVMPKIKIAIQQNQQGTGDAVKAARKLISEKEGVTLIVYGDTPFISKTTLKKLRDALLAEKKKHAVAVLGFMPDDPAEYGRLVVDDFGVLSAIVEFKDATPKERMIDVCNSGVMAVRSELLFKLLDKVDNKNRKKEYYLTDLVKVARKAGFTAAVSYASEDEVLGINNRTELSQAEYMMQVQLRINAMNNGATLVDPDTVYLRHDTKIGSDVTVHPHVYIGAGVSIADGVEIRSYTHIEQAKIKAGAIIGPFARIRPGAEIGENAHIGNFVEIKKAVIGKGAKANHLSYIGDATVGAGSNIGAGTITCNYDGYNKYKTTIGENAFIGSNTSLVAPVKVGRGAIIGAGSTIIKDVPADSLAINEMPQKNIAKGAQKIRTSRKKKR